MTGPVGPALPPDGRRYAASLSRHPVAAHAVGEAAADVLEVLGDRDPDLLVCFVSPHFAGILDDVAHALAGIFDPGVLIGMSAVAIVGGPREVEGAPAVSLFAAVVPGARITPVALRSASTGAGPGVTGWPELDHDPAVMLLLTDPFSFAVDDFLRERGTAQPRLRVIGGAASSARGPGGNRLLLDAPSLEDAGPVVRADGAVGVTIDGVDVGSVVSQGCRPVGNPYVVTRATGNRIDQLAGSPALERLHECVDAASPADLELMAGGLQLGIVVDEHLVEFRRGDFLVRGVTGADPDAGSFTVAGPVEVGHTVQFHVRDARAADADLRESLTGEAAAAALLFTCSDRGTSLFGAADHDAAVVDGMLGPLPLAGAFCAGEFGPVGTRSHRHGFSASVALFA
jgi:small ligand-binding sensory domain FIST